MHSRPRVDLTLVGVGVAATRIDTSRGAATIRSTRQMLNVVADASSLIVLARLNGLGLVASTLGVIGLTRDVEAEVVTAGKANGYEDAVVVEQAIVSSALMVMDLTEKERTQAATLVRNVSGLSLTDCRTIVCGRERGFTLLIDDQRARRVAIAEGVRCLNIQMLPLLGYVRRKLAYTAATTWTAHIGEAMHTDPVILEALAAAMAEISRLRGDREGGSP